MSPQKSVTIKCALIGFGIFLSSLAQATLGSDLELGEAIFALSTGFAGALGYAGLGYSTNLEATGNPK